MTEGAFVLSVNAQRAFGSRPNDITVEQARERFPEAMVWFDWALPHLAEGAVNLRFRDDSNKHGAKLRVIPTSAELNTTNNRAACWSARYGVWVRFTRGISSYPRRDMQRYPVLGATYFAANGSVCLRDPIDDYTGVLGP